MIDKDKLTYLASAYTAETPEEEERNFRDAAFFAGRLYDIGYNVISPIAMSHPARREADLPGDFAYWERLDSKLMGICEQLIVLDWIRWDGSTGVKYEIRRFIRDKKPVARVRFVPQDRTPDFEPIRLCWICELGGNLLPPESAIVCDTCKNNITKA